MPMLRPRVTMASDQGPEDPYLLKLAKYIPAEVVAVYVTLSGTLAVWTSPSSPWVSLGCVAFLAVITPLWIRYATSDPDANVAPHRFQMYSGLVAFLLWVFATGGSWTKLLGDAFEQDRPVIGSIMVGLATLLIPLLEKIFAPPPTVPKSVF